MIDLRRYNFVLEHYGEARCAPSHNFGPGVKTSFLIVFILNGKGEFTVNNVTRTLSKRDIFMIEPHVIHQYTADKDDPWHYAWISFSDDDFLKTFQSIKSDNGVRKVRNVEMILHYISQLKRNERYENTGYKSVRDDAIIKLFLSELLAEDHDVFQPRKVINVQRIKDYIENNYFLPLTVENLSQEFNFNRSYLCRLFKEVEGKSPKDYIIDSKMRIACKLFLESNLSVENVSRSVGYNDSFNFSKMFKKRIGLPPQEYKKYIENTLKQYF